MSTVRFDGRVAVITGAGGGLGRTYALDLAQRGAAVVVNDLGCSYDGHGQSSNMADQVVEEIRRAGGKAVASYDSVSSPAGGTAIVAKAIESFGRIDVLINNAGTLRNALFDELQDATIDEMINVHLKGAFHVTRPAFRLMKQQRYGRILFASSAAGMLGNATQTAYGAAKAGLVGLMNVLSQEGRAYNVLCNALLPTAQSRMGAAMPTDQLQDIEVLFGAAAAQVGNAGTPPFVTPLVTYLVSEACRSTHGIYSASLGRYARAFLAVSDGWVGPRDAPPTADDIAAHFGEISSTKSFSVPESLRDEFVEIIKLLNKHQPRLNAAEILLRKIFRLGEPGGDVFADPGAHIHADARISLFGPSGDKETLVGRDAFVKFVHRCAEALAGRSDEIVAIEGIDEECALVHARAWRKSKASGEELHYEWCMLYRVEKGMVTYAADMLDADAQAFWGRILQPCAKTHGV
jgi:NAD(P)-dependent dehydrogenase (short-subunit alcohol dehydrogenase family)